MNEKAATGVLLTTSVVLTTAWVSFLLFLVSMLPTAALLVLGVLVLAVIVFGLVIWAGAYALAGASRALLD